MERSQWISCENPAGRTDKKGTANMTGNKNQIWYWLHPDKYFPNILFESKIAPIMMLIKRLQYKKCTVKEIMSKTPSAIFFYRGVHAGHLFLNQTICHGPGMRTT